MGRAVCLQVGEAPALVQFGEVAREHHGVRLVDPGGGRWRGRGCGFLARTLAGSHDSGGETEPLWDSTSQRGTAKDHPARAELDPAPAAPTVTLRHDPASLTTVT